MLSVLLIWTVILLTAGAVGLGVFTIARYRPRRLVSYWLAGLTACTVYAETWSLFGGVSRAAFLVLLVLCALIPVVFRDESVAFFRRLREAFSDNPIRTVLGAIAILLLCLATARGNWHPDTPLYHAQSIHWIEAYGVIPGLGNLQSDFAYNNACFSLYALYSFAWLGGQSYHAVQGFFAVLLAVCVTDLSNILPLRVRSGDRRKATRLPETADALRLAAAVQILLLADELVSPSSDSMILLLEHLLLILWVECVDAKETSPLPYAWLSMLAVYAVTVKLAAVPLLLLALLPVGRLLRGGRGSKTISERDPGEAGSSRTAKGPALCARFFLLGIGITVPFFARGIILSGWLLYPGVTQHLIRFPWQIPDGVGQFESFEIRQNGRMILDMREADTSLFGWVDAWFIRQPRSARLLFYVTLSAAVLVLIHVLWTLFRQCILRTGREEHPGERGADAAACFTELVLSGACLFWFFSTPQMRFGQGYLLMLSAAVYGRLALRLLRIPRSERFRRWWETAAGMLALLAVSLFLLAGFLLVRMPGTRMTDVLIRQQDYDRYPVRAYTIAGIEIYCPTDFVYTGYYAFPATRWEDTDVHALGRTVRDGFSSGN